MKYGIYLSHMGDSYFIEDAETYWVHCDICNDDDELVELFKTEYEAKKQLQKLEGED